MDHSPDGFRILSAIRQTEIVAAGRGVQQASRLRRKFGGQRWRKMKGVALVEKYNGWIGQAEIHWYEAHGIGKVDWKIKRQLER